MTITEKAGFPRPGGGGMRFAAGLDGGGTKTLVECRDGDGTVLCRETFGPFNLNSIGEARFSALLDEIAGFLAERGECVSLCAGAAGVSNPAVKELFRKAMTEAGIPRWQLVGDHEIALWGALSGQPGCALIAGTGSICCGRNAAGQFARTGGWGHLIDDGGSGYALGRDALAAVVRQWDGRGKTTILSELVEQRLELHTPQDLVGYVYGGDKSRVAAVSRLVSEAAQARDPVAEGIYCKNGAELALLVTATARKLGMESCKVALLGGQLVHDPLLRAVLEAELAQAAPGLACVEAEQDAAAGAALMALAASDLGGR